MYKGVQSSYDNDRRTAEGMPSGLRVNLLGSLHMNFRTSSGYMVMLDNSAVVGPTHIHSRQVSVIINKYRRELLV